MDKNNKFVKTVLPIVAVLVLLESVILITKNAGRVKDFIVNNPTPTEKVDKEVAFETQIVTNKETLKVGEVATVSVLARALNPMSIDSANVYLKINTKAFDISKLSYDDRLPKPAFSKVSTTKDMVVVNYLITEADGFRTEKDESMALVSFEIKPKVEGTFDLELSTGNEMKESATMFVENATSKVLPYSGDKLTINVVKK
ncbi:hypothetical protein KBC75_02220 [Candidatus Shapirobacteria bacterium]|nr:hypothetical protein [Candidatus Shapirobacteria bacterium]